MPPRAAALRTAAGGNGHACAAAVARLVMKQFGPCAVVRKGATATHFEHTARSCDGGRAL
jgi:hypothetical protein